MNKKKSLPFRFVIKKIFQVLFLLIILINSPSLVLAQGDENPNNRTLHKAFITQAYSYSYKSHDHNHYVNETVFCENAAFNNMSLGLHYNLHFPNHIEFLSNISYTYEKDYATYKLHYMDDYGVSEVHYKVHLISFDAGVKFFIPRKWNRLYFRVSTSVSFSIYRKNEFYVPGRYHYQEFKTPKFSSMNLLTGIGFDIPIIANQFINIEFGHNAPANGYTNVVYSYKWYVQIGYGFTF